MPPEQSAMSKTLRSLLCLAVLAVGCSATGSTRKLLASHIRGSKHIVPLVDRATVSSVNPVTAASVLPPSHYAGSGLSGDAYVVGSAGDVYVLVSAPLDYQTARRACELDGGIINPMLSSDDYAAVEQLQQKQAAVSDIGRLWVWSGWGNGNDADCTLLEGFKTQRANCAESLPFICKLDPLYRFTVADDGRKYILHPSQQTAAQADTVCRQLGATLVDITSPSGQSAVEKLCFSDVDYVTDNTPEFCWIENTKTVPFQGACFAAVPNFDIDFRDCEIPSSFVCSYEATTLYNPPSQALGAAISSKQQNSYAMILERLFLLFSSVRQPAQSTYQAESLEPIESPESTPKVPLTLYAYGDGYDSDDFSTYDMGNEGYDYGYAAGQYQNEYYDEEYYNEEYNYDPWGTYEDDDIYELDYSDLDAYAFIDDEEDLVGLYYDDYELELKQLIEEEAERDWEVLTASFVPDLADVPASDSQEWWDQVLLTIKPIAAVELQSVQEASDISEVIPTYVTASQVDIKQLSEEESQVGIVQGQQNVAQANPADHSYDVGTRPVTFLVAKESCNVLDKRMGDISDVSFQRACKGGTCWGLLHDLPTTNTHCSYATTEPVSYWFHPLSENGETGGFCETSLLSYVCTFDDGTSTFVEEKVDFLSAIFGCLNLGAQLADLANPARRKYCDTTACWGVVSQVDNADAGCALYDQTIESFAWMPSETCGSVHAWAACQK